MFNSKQERLEQENRVFRLAERIEALEKDNEELHERLSIAKLRFEHIEYYLGIRQHSFGPGERRWDFQQVKKDLTHDNRPLDLTSLNKRQKKQEAIKHSIRKSREQ